MTTIMAMLIDTIIKSSIIIGITFGMALLLRKASAALRHLVWTAGLLSALALPVLGLVLPSWQPTVAKIVVRPAAPIIPEADLHTAVSAKNPTPAAIPHSASIVTPVRAAASIWLLGMIAIGLLLLVEFAKLARVAFYSDSVRQQSWRTVLHEVSLALQLKRTVQLMRNSDASVLGTWGTLRPRVLLPRESESWSGERMRVVLGHELAHIKRNDWLVQMIAESARAVYWFNPLFWIACEQLRRESEHACDDSAMRLGIDGPTYATHVLDLARTLKHSGQSGTAVLAMASSSNLERRLVAMLNPALNRGAATRGKAAIVVLSALALTLPLAAMQSSPMTLGPPAIQFEKPASMPATIMLPLTQRAPAGAPTARLAQPQQTTPVANAQTTGSISGKVSDPSGALVPGVLVVLTGQDSGMPIRALSNDSGFFTFPQLPPGNYSMTAKLADFATSKVSSIPVNAGQDIQTAIHLRIGLFTVMDVSAKAPVGTCLALIGTIRTDGTSFTRADCPGLPAALPERNSPTASVPPPDDILVLGSSPITAAPPQPPAAGLRPPIRVGGDIQAGNLIDHPFPVFPPTALENGLQGSVILSAVIDKYGNVQSPKVVSSTYSIFEESTIEAVQKWRYKPTLLNKEPIDTPTTINVNYTIGR